MILEWPDSFDRQLDRLEAESEAGNEHSSLLLDYIYAELSELEALEHAPLEESATFKRVRQSRKVEVWRVSHPFHPEVAVRLIVWFPPGHAGRAVVVLFSGDKKTIGDTFYNSVESRATTTISTWIYEQSEGGKT